MVVVVVAVVVVVVAVNDLKSFFLIFQNSIRVSNGLDPDQNRRSVGTDLGPNCLQRLSGKEKSPLAREEFRYKDYTNN